MKIFDRRFDPEAAKFTTQKQLTFLIVAIFAIVTGWVLALGTVEQKSAIVQCWIGLAIGAVAYWISSSKGAADNRDQLNKMLPSNAPGTTTITPPATIAVTTEGETNVTKS